jgi:hypothetical protein
VYVVYIDFVRFIISSPRSLKIRHTEYRPFEEETPLLSTLFNDAVAMNYTKMSSNERVPRPGAQRRTTFLKLGDQPMASAERGAVATYANSVTCSSKLSYVGLG